MFTVTISGLDGRVFWQGLVPEEDVVIERPPNAPATCTIRTRMLDASAVLRRRDANECPVCHGEQCFGKNDPPSIRCVA